MFSKNLFFLQTLVKFTILGVVIFNGLSIGISAIELSTERNVLETEFKQNNKISKEVSGVLEKKDCDLNYDSSSDSKEYSTSENFSQGGIWETSKNELNLEFLSQKISIFGQKNYNSNYTNLIQCVISHTISVTNQRFDFGFNPENLNTSTRILVFDSKDEFSNIYNKTYKNELGSVVPWGLFENDTISTFTRLNSNSGSISDSELKDIKYRLSYNIAHEYFHRIFKIYRSKYIPFVEEALATFIAGEVINKFLDPVFICEYNNSFKQLIDYNKLNQLNLGIEIAEWNKDDQINKQYAIGYYYISYLDKKNVLKKFLNEFLNDPENLKNLPEEVTHLNEFKSDFSVLYKKSGQNCTLFVA